VLTGRARPPAGPDEAQANQQTLADMRNRDDGNPPNVYGDRVFFPLGPPFVEENRMDDYFDSASARASAYAPTAAVASSAVAVTVNGAPVAVAPDGSFTAAVAGDFAEVVVTDGAGARTRRFLPEPSGALGLAAGTALLLGLRRWRDRFVLPPYGRAASAANARFMRFTRVT
jgi:hypothetical protein